MKYDEKKFISTAESYLASARSGDWGHAQRVAKWVKVLGQGREDLSLLVCAGLIHDIGWSGVAPKGKIDYDEMLRLEPQANANSSRLILEILARFEFSESEIGTVQRLVAAADKHRSEREDEAVIVDADNLSKLCVEHLQEKYQVESYPKLIQTWENELSYRIQTPKGKKLFPKLLNDLKQSIFSILNS
jgi:hypothetical protein